MIARLFYLKSCGCCGCISAVVSVLVAAVLLLIVLQLTMPGAIQTLCTQANLQEMLCATPIP